MTVRFPIRPCVSRQCVGFFCTLVHIYLCTILYNAKLAVYAVKALPQRICHFSRPPYFWRARASNAALK